MDKSFQKKAVLLNDTSFGLHHGCTIVIEHVERLLAQQGIRIINRCPVGMKWDSNKQLLHDIRHADIVIVNGEGTIHHNLPRARELVTIAAYSKKNNIPCVLINALFQENDQFIIEHVRLFDKIYVRDSWSGKQLANFGINGNVVPDLTFYSNTNYGAEDKNTTNDLVLFFDNVDKQVSEQLLHISRNIPNSRYISILYEVSRQRSPGLNMQAILRGIQKVFQTGYRSSLFESRHFGIEDFNEFIALIQRAGCIVSGRYHAVCFALQNMIPFIAVPSNTFKIEALIDDVKLKQERLVNLNTLNEQVIHSLEEFEECEKIHIKQYLSNARLKIENMFNEIAQLI
jgi:polysaccharide pyruvyl transferase WcaK-like protein